MTTLHERIRATVLAYVSGFATGDVEAILALYSDAGSVEDPVGSPVVRGREALAAFYTRAMRMQPRLTLTGPICIAGTEAAFPFTGTVTTRTGAMSFDCIDVMRFTDEGKIDSMRAFFGPDNMRRAVEP